MTPIIYGIMAALLGIVFLGFILWITMCSAYALGIKHGYEIGHIEGHTKGWAEKVIWQFKNPLHMSFEQLDPTIDRNAEAAVKEHQEIIRRAKS